jgi:hypothetical protein
MRPKISPQLIYLSSPFPKIRTYRKPLRDQQNVSKCSFPEDQVVPKTITRPTMDYLILPSCRSVPETIARPTMDIFKCPLSEVQVVPKIITRTTMDYLSTPFL